MKGKPSTWFMVAVLVAGLLMSSSRVVTQPQGVEADGNFYLTYFVTSLIVTVFTWIAAFRGPAATRRPWWWIAVASTVMLLPQPVAIVEAVTTGSLSLPVIMIVLSGRILWSPLILVGFLLFPMRPLTGQQRARFIADITTLVGGSFVISWYFQLGPALSMGKAGLTLLTVLSFSITDLVLIFGVCALVMRNGLITWRSPLPVFIAGFCAYLAGDVFYAHKLLAGPMQWGTPISLVFNCACLIMAAAAVAHVVRPDALAAAPVANARSSVAYLPYVALLGGYAMLLFAAAREGSIYPWGGLAAGLIVMTGAVVFRQILALRENHRLVVRDHLTGLANRISADAALGAVLRRHQQDGEPSALLLIDLDGFKKINDTRGHEAGDAVLASFGAILERTVRSTDVAARVGGDEFVVVLDRPGSPEQALAVAERILEAANVPVRLDDESVLIRASIGIAMTDPSLEPAVVKHRADMAMYVAKRGGRHRAQLWHPGLQDAADADEAFETDLANAVDAGQMRVLYQPITRVATGEIIGVEALVRWEHPSMGLVAPDRFIAVAERTGAIERIGLWVLEQATTQVVRWQRASSHHLYVSVNLSPLQLQQPDLVQQIRARLTESGLTPRDLVLELTESALVYGSEAITVLEGIRDLGVRIAVDDFGTGYSSLRYLTRLPVDILKLDRCFVAELNGNPEGSAVAEAVCRLAQALHLQTVAEGVETAEQATELTLLGYDYGQGYYYARPLTADAFEERLAQQPAGTPS